MSEENKDISTEKSEHHHHHHHSSSEHTHHSSSGHSHHSSHHSSSSKKSGKKKSKRSYHSRFGHFYGVCLTIFTFLAVFLLSVSLSIFNTANITKIATSEKYLSQLYEEETTTAVTWAANFNLPKKIFSGVLTEDNLKTHVKDYIKQTVKGREVKLDTAEMKAKLKKNIEAELKSSKIEITDAKKQSINSFTDYYAQLYQFDMNVRYFNHYNNVKFPFTVGFIIAEILLLLLIPINALLIANTHKNQHKISRHISYGFLASGTMSLIIPAYIKLSGMYKTLNIASKVSYTFYMLYFDSLMNKWMLLSLIPLAIGAIFIIVTRKRKKKLRV